MARKLALVAAFSFAMSMLACDAGTVDSDGSDGAIGAGGSGTNRPASPDEDSGGGGIRPKEGWCARISVAQVSGIVGRAVVADEYSGDQNCHWHTSLDEEDYGGVHVLLMPSTKEAFLAGRDAFPAWEEVEVGEAAYYLHGDEETPTSLRVYWSGVSIILTPHDAFSDVGPEVLSQLAALVMGAI